MTLPNVWTRADGVQVSTVGLVFPQPCMLASCGCTRAYYETMVIGGENDGRFRRYHTMEEALGGHDAAVQELQEETT